MTQIIVVRSAGAEGLPELCLPDCRQVNTLLEGWRQNSARNASLSKVSVGAKKSIA